MKTSLVSNAILLLPIGFVVADEDTSSVCEEGLSNIRVEIHTDGFPEETTWVVTDQEAVLRQGGPYDTPLKRYQDNFCALLDDDSSCVVFEILDSDGDGLLSEDGYTISVNDEIIRTGGSFGNSEVTRIGNACTPTMAPSSMFSCDEDKEALQRCRANGKYCVESGGFPSNFYPECTPNDIHYFIGQTTICFIYTQCNQCLKELDAVLDCERKKANNIQNCDALNVDNCIMDSFRPTKCGAGFSYFHIVMVTSVLPYQGSWILSGIEAGSTLVEGGPYYNRNQVFEDDYCFPEDSCLRFAFRDSQHGVENYTISVNGEVIDTKPVEGFYETTIPIGSCDLSSTCDFATYFLDECTVTNCDFIFELATGIETCGYHQNELCYLDLYCQDCIEEAENFLECAPELYDSETTCYNSTFEECLIEEFVPTECGPGLSNLKIEIDSGWNPEWIRWKIQNHDTKSVLVQGKPFYVPLTVIRYDLCFSPGTCLDLVTEFVYNELNLTVDNKLIRSGESPDFYLGSEVIPIGNCDFDDCVFAPFLVNECTTTACGESFPLSVPLDYCGDEQYYLCNLVESCNVCIEEAEKFFNCASLIYDDEAFCFNSTLDKCATGTFVPTECDEGFLNLRVEIRTDNYPEETSWRVMDIHSFSTLLNGGLYFKEDFLYRDDMCIPVDSCISFAIFDSGENGFDPNGNYKVSLGNQVVAAGGNFEYDESAIIGSACTSISVCEQERSDVIECIDSGVCPTIPDYPGERNCQKDQERYCLLLSECKSCFVRIDSFFKCYFDSSNGACEIPENCNDSTPPPTPKPLPPDISPPPTPKPLPLDDIPSSIPTSTSNPTFDSQKHSTQKPTRQGIIPTFKPTLVQSSATDFTSEPTPFSEACSVRSTFFGGRPYLRSWCLAVILLR